MSVKEQAYLAICLLQSHCPLLRHQVQKLPDFDSLRFVFQLIMVVKIDNEPMRQFKTFGHHLG